MNIYFACSITGGRQDEKTYQLIVEALLADGHAVPTAHLSQADALSYEAITIPAEIYSRDINWIEGCQVLIAEVSTPSHGVGYEIAYALSIGKPVLCCYKTGKRVSKMITGNNHSNITVKAYQYPMEIVEFIRSFLNDMYKITPNI
jgi:2'-deoxynucleoside 5'-phosphate N-hydrolase